MMVGLQVAGEIEEVDIWDIQLGIDSADHQDLISTCENLLCGSQNHLRAFVKQIEINGGEYDPLMDADELAEIVGPPVMRKCGK